MHLRLLLVLCLGLAACIGDSEPDPLVLRPTTSHPDSLLARLDARALEAAFQQLAEAGYTAEMTVTTLSDRSDEVYRQVVQVQGNDVEIIEASSSPSPDDIEEPFIAFDPVARLLPKEPPFQNATVREMYAIGNFARFRGLPSESGSIAGASAELSEGSDPIVNAGIRVDTTTGQVTSAHIRRESLSAVFDETSEATVHLVQRGGKWWPATGWMITDVDVPLSDRRVWQLEWRVLSIGGVELAPDSTD